MSAPRTEPEVPGGRSLVSRRPRGDHVSPQDVRVLVRPRRRAQGTPLAAPSQRRARAVVGALACALPAVALVLLVDRVSLVALVTVLAWALVAALRASSTGFRTCPRDPWQRAVFFIALVGVGAATSLVSGSGADLAIGAVALACSVELGCHVLKALDRRDTAVVLVGSCEQVERWATRAKAANGVSVRGACVLASARTIPVQSPLDVPTERTLDAVPELVADVGATSVLLLPGEGVGEEEVRNLAWMFDSTHVALRVAAPLSCVAGHRKKLGSVGDLAVIDVAPPRPRAETVVLKSVLDRAGSALLLVLLWPVLLTCCLLVRLDSPGPAFFVQTRVGRAGKPFRMYKLRSMCTGAESERGLLQDENDCDGALFKLRSDPRVTRVGRWLRRSSLDELPQLINVVRGDMSLVGPRPALPEEVATYDDATRRRLSVKPGITGLWQVSGRSDLSWEESVRLDIFYADNVRLLDDLAITARTVVAVTQGRGAY
jgi:exopolysaccharide biosynthesis polyprenyl glycosylphosphotransferase